MAQIKNRIILVRTEDNWYHDVYLNGKRVGNVPNNEHQEKNVDTLLADMGITEWVYETTSMSYTSYLERMIETTREDKDMQREHWAFCQALKMFENLMVS